MERFRRYKRLSEMASYEGNLGAEEVMKFYMSDETTDDDIESFEDFLKKDDNESAWKLLQRILGTDLVGIPHDEDDIVITIDDDRDLNEMSLRMDTLDDPFAEENSSTHPKQVRERMPRMKLLMEQWKKFLAESEDDELDDLDALTLDDLDAMELDDLLGLMAKLNKAKHQKEVPFPHDLSPEELIDRWKPKQSNILDRSDDPRTIWQKFLKDAGRTE